MTAGLTALRRQAVAASLRPAETIAEALAAMRFLQLDPIRAPARAADLILRQRIVGYRAGDLDRAYPSLDLAEDYIHVYGVMPHATRDLLHPRRASHRFRVEREHPRLASRVFAHVQANGETHPRDLVALGNHRTTSGWGNDSTATTRVLEALHFRGKLRVTRRVNGVKLYALADPPPEPQAPAVRADAIFRLLLDLYAPLPEPTFRQIVRMVTDASVSPTLAARTLDKVRHAPDVERLAVDRVTWLRAARTEAEVDVEDRVRFLAPFDPVVWDRRRFTLLWGWDYRFEAYTPASKRKLGYYALPLLWRDDVIGWANAAMLDHTLTVDVGYAGKPPRDATFRRELAAEAERLREFLGAERFVIRAIK